MTGYTGRETRGRSLDMCGSVMTLIFRETTWFSCHWRVLCVFLLAMKVPLFSSSLFRLWWQSTGLLQIIKSLFSSKCDISENGNLMFWRNNKGSCNHWWLILLGTGPSGSAGVGEVPSDPQVSPDGFFSLGDVCCIDLICTENYFTHRTNAFGLTDRHVWWKLQ